MTMNDNRKTRRLCLVLALAIASLIGLLLPTAARAIIGRPLTPMSYAGVARRTTRRTVAYTAAASSVAYPVAQPVVW
jgi:hypothetical protein